MVAPRENSALAKQLLSEAVSRHDIEPSQLIVHQDRGAPLTSHGFIDLLAELGVDRSADPLGAFSPCFMPLDDTLFYPPPPRQRPAKVGD